MADKKFLDEDGTQRLVDYFKHLLERKIDASEGKQLSTEDFTTELKEKLEAIEISGSKDIEIYGGSASDVIDEGG